ncbi:hypothetical protein SAMN03159341_1346 [Paenibacillus sp. 1_12]|nr:hypothetical protein SAMN03159341_1346 [Paenibacillus sp. 1_12]
MVAGQPSVPPNHVIPHSGMLRCSSWRRFNGNLKPEDEEMRKLRKQLVDLKEKNEILKKAAPTLRKI